MAYVILFASSFLAATILPFYSEIVLFSMLTQGYSSALLVTIATLGNTLGAVVNWVLGRYLLRYQDRKWFYFKQERLKKVQEKFNRFGVWSLLLAWLPIGGDALTFIAGIMRVKLWQFLILVGMGKLLRYIAVVYFADMLRRVGLMT